MKSTLPQTFTHRFFTLILMHLLDHLFTECCHWIFMVDWIKFYSVFLFVTYFLQTFLVNLFENPAGY